MKLISRLALAIAGAGLVVSGTVLLVQAAWGGIALALGALWASAMIGVLLTLVGVIVLLLARRRRPEAAPLPMSAVIGAFFEGLHAGQATAGHGDETTAPR